MRFDYRYHGSSNVQQGTGSTAMSFAPDTLREPTYFRGQLRHHLPFREAISALHGVVVSDLRFQPRDLTEYKAWLASQEELWLADAYGGRDQVQTARQIADLTEQIRAIDRRRQKIMEPYREAERRYWKWLYKRHYNLWYILDPVITVHPDELFFECFSEDESSYGKLSCNYNVFGQVGDFACGTTNIDYSAALYDEFQKIRDYKQTQLTVDPDGFEVETTAEDAYREVKIDLPESWVRGFLQVSSAMTLDRVSFVLHPMDVHNLCFVLRRNKERHGPRSLRWRLEPGQPVRVRVEPWDLELTFARSPYTGTGATEVRTWGRRRLLILERLIPVADRFRVSLLGTGLPSFFEADLGDMTFTLGLSGWTANDWSRMGQFDLMAPRRQVEHQVKLRVFEALRKTWFATADELARALGIDRAEVVGALSAWTQAGRVIYDMRREVYRVRELSREPLPFSRLRFANEREERANQLQIQAVRADLSPGPLDGPHRIPGERHRAHPTYRFNPHHSVPSVFNNASGSMGYRGRKDRTFWRIPIDRGKGNSFWSRGSLFSRRPCRMTAPYGTRARTR